MTAAYIVIPTEAHGAVATIIPFTVISTEAYEAVAEYAEWRNLHG